MQQHPKKRIIHRFYEQRRGDILPSSSSPSSAVSSAACSSSPIPIILSERERELASHVAFAQDIIISWLRTYDHRYASYHAKHRFKALIHTCTHHLARMLKLLQCDELYLHVIYYCDGYIRKKSSISVADILQVLIVSAMITLKFWDDERVDNTNAVVSKLSSLPLQTLRQLELDMLQALNYELLVDESVLKKFKETKSANRLTELHTANINSTTANDNNSPTTTTNNNKRRIMLMEASTYNYYNLIQYNRGCVRYVYCENSDEYANFDMLSKKVKKCK